MKQHRKRRFWFWSWLAWVLALGGASAADARGASAEKAGAGALPLPADHVPNPTRSGAASNPPPAGGSGAWWAFEPLGRVTPPAVRNEGWVRTPVDRFLLARMEARGLEPGRAADRRTLVRRAFLDLLGLPPTPGEVESFVADRAPDGEAWRKRVRGLLDRPEYGERWARYWLDVARFAESSGFEHDYDRPGAYHYRDFVIRALNEDLPYDRFVRLQLAGDEFEPENPQALMATGFLGAGVFPTQITANEVERTRYDAMDDMLSTTGTAMLGLTVGCARCHDHKSDPISMDEYYRMLATFTTTVRSELELDLDPETSRRDKAAFDAAHAPLAEALRRYEEGEVPAKFAAWLAMGAPARTQPVWEVLELGSAHSKAGAGFRRLADGSYLVEGKNGDTDRYTLTADVRGTVVSALRLEALADPSMTREGPGRAENGNIGLSRIRLFAAALSGGPTNEIPLVNPRATFEQDRGHLSIASALDDNPRTGWAVDPRFGTNHAAAFELGRPWTNSAEGTRLTVVLEFELNTRHNIGRPRLSVSAEANPALDGDSLPDRVAGALAKAREQGQDGERAKLGAEERAVLLDWWKRGEPGWQAVAGAVAAHRRTAPKPRLTRVLTCTEGNPPVRMHTQGADFFPETYFLKRGSTEQKRDVVTPGFLRVLAKVPDPDRRWSWKPPGDAKYSGRRRTLANWMTDTDHGAGHLLARVIVNRLWHHHFGRGIVATPNDFGVLGARPSHPELLDWLAGELIRQGWRLKPIHELLMTSAAYQLAPERRASAAADPRPPADPEDFRTFRPRRLEAEAIRDSVLAVCGVLATNRYGPGTLDEASTRRSIYFTVKRSQMVGSMQVFDAPEPLVSQGTRPATTVAPQALLLMNSRHVRAWVERFVDRIAPGPDATAGEAVARAYGLALGRPPTDAEWEASVEFIRHQTAIHRESAPDRARERALADFAQAVLSLNEFVYVE